MRIAGAIRPQLQPFLKLNFTFPAKYFYIIYFFFNLHIFSFSDILNGVGKQMTKTAFIFKNLPPVLQGSYHLQAHVYCPTLTLSSLL